jgi:uncharacterized protein YjbJ (UPF0337 family)
MSTQKIEGTWNEQKARLKKECAVLMDNDLMFDEARNKEMFAKLQIKLGKTEEELHKIIAGL